MHSRRAEEERITNLRSNHTFDVPQNQVIVAVENCLVELTPESWYDIGCVHLDDPLTGTKLTTFTQATPVPNEIINRLKFETPSSYKFADSGFSMTVGRAMAERLDVSHEQWHEAHAGVGRPSLIYLATSSLAHLYKNRIFFKRPPSAIPTSNV